MKILFVGKYPPIEGGTAARTYWLARMLGERGHQVAVVTNAPRVEEEYRTHFDISDPATRKEYNPKNVTLFTIDHAAPRHIPYSESFVSRLVNEGLRAIAEHGADVIYAYYLEPYAVAGLMLKELTGLPLVVQHAGSDIYRILRDKEYMYLMGRVLQNADTLILGRSLVPLAESLKIPASHIETGVRPVYPHVFAPEGEHFIFPDAPVGVPIITYLGKANGNKGLGEFFDALLRIPQDVRVYLFSNGAMRAAFVERIASDERLSSRVQFMDFVAPWVVPRILRSSDLLLQLEHNFPVPIHNPIQPYEGILSQTPLLLSEEVFQKIGPSFPKTRELFCTVHPANREALAEKLSYVLTEQNKAKENAKMIREEYTSSHTAEDALTRYENIFTKAAAKKKWFRRLL